MLQEFWYSVFLPQFTELNEASFHNPTSACFVSHQFFKLRGSLMRCTHKHQQSSTGRKGKVTHAWEPKKVDGNEPSLVWEHTALHTGSHTTPHYSYERGSAAAVAKRENAAKAERQRHAWARSKKQASMERGVKWLGLYRFYSHKNARPHHTHNLHWGRGKC
jgi:hypothetical protein